MKRSTLARRRRLLARFCAGKPRWGLAFAPRVVPSAKGRPHRKPSTRRLLAEED